MKLMTVVAVVRGVDKRARVRVFLDLGSQASFISAKLVSVIQPRQLERKDVSVRTFGAEQPVIQNLERYTVQLQTMTGKTIEVSAWMRDPLGINIGTVSSELRDL